MALGGAMRQRASEHVHASARARTMARLGPALTRWYWWAEWHAASAQLQAEHLRRLLLTRTWRRLLSTGWASKVLRTNGLKVWGRSSKRAAARVIRTWRLTARWENIQTATLQARVSALRRQALVHWRLLSQHSAHVYLAQDTLRRGMRVAVQTRAMRTWQQYTVARKIVLEGHKLTRGKSMMHGWPRIPRLARVGQYHIPLRESFHWWRSTSAFASASDAVAARSKLLLPWHRLLRFAISLKHASELIPAAAHAWSKGAVRRAWKRWRDRIEPVIKGEAHWVINHMRWRMDGKWESVTAGLDVQDVLRSKSGASSNSSLVILPSGHLGTRMRRRGSRPFPLHSNDVWLEATLRSALNRWRGDVARGSREAEIIQRWVQRRRALSWQRWLCQLAVAHARVHQAHMLCMVGERFASFYATRRALAGWRRACVLAAAQRLRLRPHPPIHPRSSRPKFVRATLPQGVPQAPCTPACAAHLRDAASPEVAAEPVHSQLADAAARAAACYGVDTEARESHEYGKVPGHTLCNSTPSTQEDGHTTPPTARNRGVSPKGSSDSAGVSAVAPDTDECSRSASHIAATPSTKSTRLPPDVLGMEPRDALLLLAQRHVHAFGTGTEEQRRQFEARWVAKWELYFRWRQLKRALRWQQLQRGVRDTMSTVAVRWRQSRTGGRRRRRAVALARWKRWSAEQLRLGLAIVHATWRAGLLAFAKWHGMTQERRVADELARAGRLVSCSRRLRAALRAWIAWGFAASIQDNGPLVNAVAVIALRRALHHALGRWLRVVAPRPSIATHVLEPRRRRCVRVIRRWRAFGPAYATTWSSSPSRQVGASRLGATRLVLYAFGRWRRLCASSLEAYSMLAKAADAASVRARRVCLLTWRVTTKVQAAERLRVIAGQRECTAAAFFRWCRGIERAFARAQVKASTRRASNIARRALATASTFERWQWESQKRRAMRTSTDAVCATLRPRRMRETMRLWRRVWDATWRRNAVQLSLVRVAAGATAARAFMRWGRNARRRGVYDVAAAHGDSRNLCAAWKSWSGRHVETLSMHAAPLVAADAFRMSRALSRWSHARAANRIRRAFSLSAYRALMRTLGEAFLRFASAANRYALVRGWVAARLAWARARVVADRRQGVRCFDAIGLGGASGFFRWRARWRTRSAISALHSQLSRVVSYATRQASGFRKWKRATMPCAARVCLLLSWRMLLLRLPLRSMAERERAAPGLHLRRTRRKHALIRAISQWACQMARAMQRKRDLTQAESHNSYRSSRMAFRHWQGRAAIATGGRQFMLVGRNRYGRSAIASWRIWHAHICEEMQARLRCKLRIVKRHLYAWLEYDKRATATRALRERANLAAAQFSRRSVLSTWRRLQKASERRDALDAVAATFRARRVHHRLRAHQRCAHSPGISSVKTGATGRVVEQLYALGIGTQELQEDTLCVQPWVVRAAQWRNRPGFR